MKSLLWISLLLFSYCINKDNHPVKTATPHAVHIPFSFGINNGLYPSDSTLVQVYDPNDSLVFVKAGDKPDFGFKPKGFLQLTGNYKVHVVYFSDSLTRQQFQDTFTLDGTEQSLYLAVNLLEKPMSELHVTKYFGNKFNVKLKRLWDPQQQFRKKKQLLPNYQWTNTADSTIYGIFHRYSSSSTISWVQNWDIAFMHFQKYTDSGWVYISCNAPRINAMIKKDSSGTTLTDMDLSCAAKEFKSKNKYRVLIEYGINDAIFRKTDAANGRSACFFYEPHVYQVADEFTLD